MPRALRCRKASSWRMSICPAERFTSGHSWPTARQAPVVYSYSQYISNHLDSLLCPLCWHTVAATRSSIAPLRWPLSTATGQPFPGKRTRIIFSYLFSHNSSRLYYKDSRPAFCYPPLFLALSAPPVGERKEEEIAASSSRARRKVFHRPQQLSNCAQGARTTSFNDLLRGMTPQHYT